MGASCSPQKRFLGGLLKVFIDSVRGFESLKAVKGFLL